MPACLLQSRHACTRTRRPLRGRPAAACAMPEAKVSFTVATCRSRWCPWAPAAGQQPPLAPAVLPYALAEVTKASTFAASLNINAQAILSQPAAELFAFPYRTLARRMVDGQIQPVGLAPVNAVTNWTAALDRMWPTAPTIVKTTISSGQLPGLSVRLTNGGGGVRRGMDAFAFAFCQLHCPT